MKVSLIGGLIGNSCLLQKESLNGGTAQMVESRGKEGEKKEAKILTKFPHHLISVLLSQYRLTRNALQSTFSFVQV